MASKQPHDDASQKVAGAKRAAKAAARPVKEIGQRVVAAIDRFTDMEASGGLVLVAAAAIAMAIANSPLAAAFNAVFDTHLAIELGAFSIDKSLLHWVNDGLMAIFFFLVGLEVKREFVSGELSEANKILPPLAAAVGGMAVPAAVFFALNWTNGGVLNAWAIPTATDIAFALGVLSLLGGRVPVSVRVFLLSLAIFDDLGAIAIIAVFYSGKLSLLPFAVGAGLFLLLFVLNRLGVRRLWPFVLVGILVWAAVLKSGVHATLAGVLVALTIPIDEDEDDSPLHWLEDALHPWVAFGVIPLFALANAGVSLAGLSASALLDPLTLGIILGLVLGKPIGVLVGAAILRGFGVSPLPDGANWRVLAGVGLLAGIGFTMSLFIGTLAFDTSEHAAQIRLGVLAGSLISAGLGLMLLWASLPDNTSSPDND